MLPAIVTGKFSNSQQRNHASHPGLKVTLKKKRLPAASRKLYNTQPVQTWETTGKVAKLREDAREVQYLPALLLLFTPNLQEIFNWTNSHRSLCTGNTVHPTVLVCMMGILEGGDGSGGIRGRNGGRIGCARLWVAFRTAIILALADE